jgi:hypothetical protein
MARKNKQKNPVKENACCKASGLLIPAGLFIGMGIGFYTNFIAGLFLGLGLGFLAMALLRVICKCKN